MNTFNKSEGGLISSLKNVAALLLTSVKTRLELLGNEIDEEKRHLAHLALFTQSILFCFGFGIFLLIALLTVLFWENRLVVLGLSMLLFFGLGAFLLSSFNQSLRKKEPAFGASLAQLEEDLRALKSSLNDER